MPENVTYGGGYARYIKSKKAPVLTASQVIEIANKIEQGRLAPSFKTNREHVKHVKNIVAEKENNRIPSCPKCGASMVLLETKQGQNVGKKFWGCYLPNSISMTLLGTVTIFNSWKSAYRGVQ